MPLAGFVAVATWTCVTVLQFLCMCGYTLLPSGALHCVPLTSTAAVTQTKCIPTTTCFPCWLERSNGTNAVYFMIPCHLSWLCQYISLSQTKVKLPKSPFSLQVAGDHRLLCPWIKITKTCWIIQYFFFQPSYDGTLYCCFSEFVSQIVTQQFLAQIQF